MPRLINFAVFYLSVIHYHKFSQTKCFLISHIQHTIYSYIHNASQSVLTDYHEVDTCAASTISWQLIQCCRCGMQHYHIHPPDAACMSFTNSDDL
jgi:hypothetical protein